MPCGSFSALGLIRLPGKAAGTTCDGNVASERCIAVGDDSATAFVTRVSRLVNLLGGGVVHKQAPSRERKPNMELTILG